MKKFFDIFKRKKNPKPLEKVEFMGMNVSTCPICGCPPKIEVTKYDYMVIECKNHLHVFEKFKFGGGFNYMYAIDAWNEQAKVGKQKLIILDEIKKYNKESQER